MPTLREILEGYKRFNAWELEEQKRELPWLTVEESLMQFFELCDLARTLAPNAERIFLEQDEAYWIALHQKLQRAAKVMTDAQFAQALERPELVQRYRDLWEKIKRTGEAGEEQTS